MEKRLYIVKRITQGRFKYHDLTYQCLLAIVISLGAINTFGQEYNSTQNNIAYSSEYLNTGGINAYNDLSQLLLYNFNSSSQTSTDLVLDSIYEATTLGIYTRSYIWYYNYNSVGQIESCERHYFNSKGEYQDIVEEMIYNSKGQLTSLTKTELKDPVYLIPTPHYVITYKEEYSYTNGLLAMKLIEEDDYGTADTIRYFYNKNNMLEYRIFANAWGNNHSEKFSYELTDSTKLTKKESFYNYDITTLDSIPETSDSQRIYLDKYDKNGNIIQSTSTSINTESSTEKLKFKIEYSYNDNDQLCELLYYEYDHEIEDIRIKYTYNEQGYLKQYIKRYYNVLTETWEIENQKDYYYSPLLVSVKKSLCSKLSIYPNPATDFININNTDYKNNTYTIYNVNGKSVKRGKLENQQISINEFENGLYILRIDDKIGHGSFIKY